MLKAILKVKPKVFVNLGDVGEWESVSAWRYKDKKLPPLEFQLPIVDEDIRLVNEGLDEWDEILEQIGCKEKYLLQGNHDLWLDNFLISTLILVIITFMKHVKSKKEDTNIQNTTYQSK